MMTRFLDIKIGVKNIIPNHRSNNFKSQLPVSGIKKIIKIVKKSQVFLNYFMFIRQFLQKLQYYLLKPVNCLLLNSHLNHMLTH